MISLPFASEFDREYLRRLLCSESETLDAFANLFDFRAPAVKRAEFNALKAEAFTILAQARGSRCELDYSPSCTRDRELQVDHLIPLSTNKLNKLKNVVAGTGRKVASQSFGSNELRNLGLACRACNAMKKHEFLIA